MISVVFFQGIWTNNDNTKVSGHDCKMKNSSINQLYVKLGVSPLSEMIMVLSGSKKKYPIYIPRVCGTKTRKN